MMSPEEPPQNIYDDSEFFAGYSQMERFQGAFGRAMEHGLFLEMAGSVAGLRVLDLGCGGGQLAHHLASAGAASVTAIDVSERMLAVARERWDHPAISYQQQSMEEASFSEGSFDVVVSSLALHYIEDYKSLVARIAGWLVEGGRFVFSTEHPIYAARATDEGWIRRPDGTASGWLLDRYSDDGVRERQWFVSGVRRFHRSMATLLNGLVRADFTIERVEEPVPDEEWLTSHPQAADETRRPMFLLVQARKV